MQAAQQFASQQGSRGGRLRLAQRISAFDTTSLLMEKYSRTVIDGVTYKVADCREEREEAFRLTYNAYVKANLIPENPHGMRVTSHHLNPMTDVLVAKYQGRVVYTVTLVTDDLAGVPMDEIFPDELAELRERGGRVAEMSCLAGDDDAFDGREGYKVYTNLISLALQFARQNGVDRLLLAVHPRHARFYDRFFGCEPIGETKAYAAVQDNPAVPCVHDFAKLDKRQYKLFDQMYSIPFYSWELKRQPMSEADRLYFEEAVSFEKQPAACLATA